MPPQHTPHQVLQLTDAPRLSRDHAVHVLDTVRVVHAVGRQLRRVDAFTLLLLLLLLLLRPRSRCVPLHLRVQQPRRQLRNVRLEDCTAAGDSPQSISQSSERAASAEASRTVDAAAVLEQLLVQAAVDGLELTNALHRVGQRRRRRRRRLPRAGCDTQNREGGDASQAQQVHCSKQRRTQRGRVAREAIHLHECDLQLADLRAHRNAMTRARNAG